MKAASSGSACGGACWRRRGLVLYLSLKICVGARRVSATEEVSWKSKRRTTHLYIYPVGIVVEAETDER